MTPSRLALAAAVTAVIGLVVIAIEAGGGDDDGDGGGGARAARGIETGFADYFFESEEAADRARLLDEALAAGAGLVRLEASWRGVAPEAPADPTDPADTAYDFAVIDAAVRDASARGLEPMLNVAGAPEWAEGAGRPDSEIAPSGSWRPDAAALGEFATALARRYSGDFVPPGGEALPRVRYFEAWNEPNLPAFLTPQWQAGEPVAADVYRPMLNAFYDGIESVDRGNVVIGGALGPYGDPPGIGRTRPLLFLRDLFCLAGREGTRSSRCPGPARFDVLSHHPIGTTGGPTLSAFHPDDAATPDLGQVGRLLAAAEAAGTLGVGGPHALWATELWWESDPPDAEHGEPLARQARWYQQALYLLWRQGAAAAILLQLRDDPYDPLGEADALQAGVLFEDGGRKPSFTALRFPFVVDRLGPERSLAWWRAPRSGELSVEVEEDGAWRELARAEVEGGGVYTLPIELATGRFRASVGGERSLIWNLSP